MTFKEIDQRIEHYEIELEWCATQIKIQNRKIKSATNEIIKAELLLLKMKIEFFCFVTSSYIDLLCIYRNTKRSNSKRERQFNIKLAYLIIYETINTYLKYKGELYKTVSKENKEKYKVFFRMLNAELEEFKYEYDYDNIMSKIRNKSAAHYDKDFLNYYECHELINNKKSQEIVRQFLYFINPLHYFSYGLITGEINEFQFINSWFS